MSQSSAQTHTIHLVQKSNIAKHICINVPARKNELSQGCILARSSLVSLSANNLSYAHMGTFLHWWDAFPSPSSLPSDEYSDYGVVPVWGYADVLDSETPGISAGSLIWGFWPSHDMPVVLSLERDVDVDGHWIEVSKHRSKMMPLYNRYIVDLGGKAMSERSEAQVETLAWQSVVAPVGGAGWALNQYVFGEAAVHPLGEGTWTAEDADLSQAVVISLSASGKTARLFDDGLIHERKPGSGPLGLLAVTSSTDENLISKASFPTSTIPYNAITTPETISWLTTLNPHKIVIVEFGSRGTCLQDLTTALRTTLPDTSFIVIGVGREAKAMSPDQLAIKGKNTAEIPNFIQMNASGIFDKAMALVGKKTFFDDRARSFDRFAQRGGLEGLVLKWGEGISGEEGVEGAWSRLCQERVAPGEAMVFRVRGV